MCLIITVPVNPTTTGTAAFDAKLAKWGMRGAYKVVYESEIPRGEADIIGSHVLFKRKRDGSAKARIFPWVTVTKRRITFASTHHRSASISFVSYYPYVPHSDRSLDRWTLNLRFYRIVNSTGYSMYALPAKQRRMVCSGGSMHRHMASQIGDAMVSDVR